MSAQNSTVLGVRRAAHDIAVVSFLPAVEGFGSITSRPPTSDF